MAVLAIVRIRSSESMRIAAAGMLARRTWLTWPTRPWRVLAFSLVFTFVAFAAGYGDRREFQAVVHQGDCTLIEGSVTDYTPRRGGKPSESFRVQGVYFEYADFMPTGAFNQTAQFGGPIKSDLPVRICYHLGVRLQKNLILKLEVAE